MLGIRIGEQLMLVDDQDMKTGVFVTTIEALLRKARVALVNNASSVSTRIENTDSTLTLTRDEDGAIKITFQDRPSGPKTSVDAIGRLDWKL